MAETTNYEVSKLVRHSVVPRGELARLWVAVILDDDIQMKKNAEGKMVRTQKTRTPEDLQKIQGLVAAAVGLDQKRGDQLTVENVAFDLPSEEMGELGSPEAPALTPVPRTKWVIAGVAGVVVVLVLIGVGAKKFAPKRKARTEIAAVELPTALPRTVADLQNEISAQIDAELQGAGGQKLPTLVKKVGALTVGGPEAAAMLVRSWMAEDQH